jgi:hypothetical protein
LAWAQAYERVEGPIGWAKLDALILWLGMCGIPGIKPPAPPWWEGPKEEAELIVDEDAAHQKRLEIGAALAPLFGCNPETVT